MIRLAMVLLACCTVVASRAVQKLTFVDRGRPATVLIEDNKTMICVYSKGHGRGAIVMKHSADAGLTWSEAYHNTALVEPRCQASFIR